MFAMPQLRLIFLSLFISSVSFSMEPKRTIIQKGSCSSNNKKNNLDGKDDRSVKSKPLKSGLPSVLPMQNPSKVEKPENPIDIGLENIYLDAPDKVKDIVAHLKDPSYFNLGCWRTSYFLGKPAVGKTTLAKAVAYKLGKDWDCKFFSCRDVREKNRGNTAFNLNNFLKSIVNTKGKCIVICDEMNRLFENADDPHYDTGENSDTFWTFLDSIEDNHNFFFIGTANRLDMLSEQLDSRIEGDIIEIEGAETTADRKRILLNKFNEYSHKLHDECDDIYLDGFLEPLHGWQGRNFKKLMISSVRFAKNDNKGTSKFLIKQKHLESGRDEIIHHRTEYIKVGQKPETAEQRQDRYHRENKEQHRESIAQAKQFHDENKAQTAQYRKEDRKKQNKDAGEQIFLNMTVNSINRSAQVSFGGIGGTQQVVLEEDYETIKNALSDDKKKGFEDAQTRFAAAQAATQAQVQNFQDLLLEEQSACIGAGIGGIVGMGAAIAGSGGCILGTTSIIALSTPGIMPIATFGAGVLGATAGPVIAIAAVGGIGCFAVVKGAKQAKENCSIQ